MNDKHKTKAILIEEIGELPQSISAIINALKDSERKYRTLFEESKDVFYIGKPDGKLLDINLAGVELFGYDSKVEMLDISIERDLFVNFQERQFCMRALEEQGFIKDYEKVREILEK